MIVNKVVHKDTWKIISPVYPEVEGEPKGYTVHLEDGDGQQEIGLAVRTADNKYRLECINGRKNWITTNVLNFIIDEMVRLYEKEEVVEK